MEEINTEARIQVLESMFLLLQLSANLRMTGGIEDHCNQDINKSSRHTQ